MVLAVDFTSELWLPLRLSIVNHWTSVTTCSSRQSHCLGLRTILSGLMFPLSQWGNSPGNTGIGWTNQPGEELITVITVSYVRADLAGKYKPPREGAMASTSFQIFPRKIFQNVYELLLTYVGILSWPFMNNQIWFTYFNVCSLVTDRQCWC